MKYAISMYEGGKKVYPDECDFFSYSERGLLCPECKQEVYLRKGNIINPYFAHLHASKFRQVKQCSLRVSSDENAIEKSDFIEDRGQRLEIFQQRFISMISVEEEKIVENIEFNNWISLIKCDNSQAINKITKDCTEYFLTHYKEIVEVYCAFLNDEQHLLQKKIALTAIDYLCVQSSLQLLEYLLHYSMYKLYKHEKYKLFQQKSTTKYIYNICNLVTKIVITNPWIEVLENSKNINSLTINYSDLDYLEQVKVNSKGIVSNIIDIDINQINTTERHNLESRLDLQITFPAIEYGRIDKKSGQARQKQVFVTCKQFTEVNPDDKTAMRFSFMTSQPIKVDSRTKNTDGKYIKVATDTYLPAIVYSFGFDFSLTVETHNNLLFPKGGHLVEYTTVQRRYQLARLMEAMVDNGDIEFLKTYLDSKGKERIVWAYDDRILLLLALKRRGYLGINDASNIKNVKQTYQPISPEVVLETFIEAYQLASERSVVIPNTTLDVYHRYAQNKLA